MSKLPGLHKPSSRTHTDNAIRIASFNVWGYFGNWEKRRKILHSNWNHVDADILLLQEACADGEDQVSQISRDLGLPFGLREISHCHMDGTREGLAVLSKFPFGETKTLALPTSAPTRRIMQTQIIIGDKVLTVRNLHATYSPAETRLQQIRQATVVEDGPLIVGGDFNTRPDELQSIIDETYVDGLHNQNVCTWPVSWNELSSAWEQRVGVPPHFDYSPSRIDYLLVRQATIISSGAYALGNDKSGYASDHAIIWTDIRL